MTPWLPSQYKLNLLHHLETVNTGTTRNAVDFRFPVQYVIRPTQDFRGYAGQVASGRVAVGEEVVVLPSGLSSRVASLVTFDGEQAEAEAGESIVITLEDNIDVSRGNMLVRTRNLPHKSNRLDVTLCWMSETPLDPKASYWLQHTTRMVRALVSELNYRIDVDTMHREQTDTLQLNEIGRVQLTTTEPLFFDPYQLNRTTGNFILIDPYTNSTVAAGMIRDRSRQVDELVDVTSRGERPASENVLWEQGTISRAMRETLNGHKGAVLWLTGLSGSGKSTISRLLEQRLYRMGCHTFYLDGDNLRHGLNGDLGFAPEARKENIRRVGEVAKLAFEHANLVLCTFISPYTADRDFARSLLPEGRFFEIYVKCDIEVVKRRDPKGLYARALAGEIKGFTGIDAPYEEPVHPELVVETDLHSADELVEQILDSLRRAGIVGE